MSDKLKELHDLSLQIHNLGITPICLFPPKFKGDAIQYRIDIYKKKLKEIKNNKK